MRTSLLRWSAGLALPTALVLLASCADSPEPVGVEEPAPDRPAISAEAVEATLETDGFIWLTPVGIWSDGRDRALLDQLGEAPATGLEIELEICDQSTTRNIGCQTLQTVELDGYYAALWGTRWRWRNKVFDVRATLNGATLGSLELILNGWEFAGRPFLFSFFVGETQAEAECFGSDRCNVGGTVPGSTTPTVITTTDEDGDVMAVFTLPAGAAPSPLDLLLDCREDGFAPGEGPLPTLLTQRPLFCKILATNPDGTPFTGSLLQAATIEICVVDDDVAAQQPWHSSLDHTQLLNGKSSTGSDFQYLPFAPTPNLSGCEGITLNELPSGLGLIDRAFEGLLEWLGPQPLHATAVRRDGGVGGQIESFSDVNPVEPAYSRGTVTDGEVGFAGIQLQITGGSLTAPVSAVTDANGGYSFTGPDNRELPLEAAPPAGTDYTVEIVGGLPTGYLVDGPASQTITVDGSGVFLADFTIQQGSLEIAGFGSIYDEAVIDGVEGPFTLTDAPGPFYTGDPNSFAGTCSVLDAIVAESGTGGWAVGPNDPGTGTDVVLTLEVDVPLGTTALEILAWVDNDAKVEIADDGGAVTDITATGGTPNEFGFVVHENCANQNPLMFEAGAGTFTAGATNTFTFTVRDRGSIGYADFRVTAVADSGPVINE